MVAGHTNSSPSSTYLNSNQGGKVDCTQSLSFLLVIERLERARCAAARETGVSKVSLAPVSQLLWTRKERDCVQSSRDEFLTWTRGTWPAWGGDPAGRPRCPRNWWRSGLGRGRPAPDCSAWTRQSWATEEPRSSSGANTGTSRGKKCPHAPQPKSSRTSTSSPARLRGQHSDKASSQGNFTWAPFLKARFAQSLITSKRPCQFIYWIWDGFSTKTHHCKVENQTNGPGFFFLWTHAVCWIINRDEEFH